MSEKIGEIAEAMRKHKASGRDAATEAALRGLVAEYRELEASADAAIQSEMAARGIMEEMLPALEASRHEPLEWRLQRAEMDELPPTAWMDDALSSALEAVERSVSPAWLSEQRMLGGSLGEDFRTEPLCIASGRRLRALGPGPQRLARMILAARDYIEQRAEYDFWDGAMLVPELIAFGRALDLVPALGPVGTYKIASLPDLPDQLVASTIYEILVGAACLRAGIEVELVEEDRREKSADLRLPRFPVPARIEVKRKLDLSQYDALEAQAMRALLRRAAAATDAPFRCDIEFVVPADQLDQDLVVATLLDMLASDSTSTVATSWGSLSVRRLERITFVPRTRLYSPDYLERVFGWVPQQADFDGLVARVDPQKHVLVESAWSPQGFAWRNKIAPVPAAKARGLRAKVAEAVRQIPAGEMGFIYVAYEEGARREVADARTKQIEEELRGFHHEWGPVIPGCLAHRLYPRPLGEGRPDLIENIVYSHAAKVDPELIRGLPAHVFVPGIDRGWPW